MNFNLLSNKIYCFYHCTLRACHLFIGKFNLFTVGYQIITRVTQSWFLPLSFPWLLSNVFFQWIFSGLKPTYERESEKEVEHNMSTDSTDPSSNITNCRWPLSHNFSKYESIALPGMGNCPAWQSIPFPVTNLDFYHLRCLILF